MKITTHIPHMALQEFIEAFVVCEIEENDRITDFYPTNSAVMCFDITQTHFRFGGDSFRFSKESDRSSLCFVGVINNYFALEHIPKKTIRVMFKPYGAFRFFGAEMSVFTNLGTDVRLVAPDITDIVSKMEDSFGKETVCVKLLETYFLEKLRKKQASSSFGLDRISFACNEIKKYSGTIQIKELCKKINMSENRFRVHFNEKVGISPKAFCQIEKMNRVNQMLIGDKNADWASLCENFNFFDQAHFIKSFKTYFGCTPTQFLQK
ncbi:helix-turn-helix domain-containing protein [Flavobacterium microcysteis]